MTYMITKESFKDLPMPSPSDNDLINPIFNAIWEVTKTWDVNVPEYYEGYCGLNGSHVKIILDAISPLLDKAEKSQVEPVTPDFFQLENGSEYWFECPDDEAIIGDLTDVEIGTEYDVFASHTYRQTYRVTKLPDEKDYDTEVELVSSQRTYYTSPPDQSAKIAELEAEIARLKAIT